MPQQTFGCTDCQEQGSDFALRYVLDEVNLRLRVDDYQGNLNAISDRIFTLAKEHAFTKVFVKTREEDWLSLLSRGYVLEGIYKGYFEGRDAYCMAAYLEAKRKMSGAWIEEDHLLRKVLALPVKPQRAEPEDDGVLRRASTEDAEMLAAMYGQAFRSYPTPMSDPCYVAKVIAEGTLFYIYEHKGWPISAASAEINGQYRNAEITDCVTLPDYRGKGLMNVLIQALEDDLAQRQIHCAYSLSRARSFGMNAALRHRGYAYCGRLTNNCEMDHAFEDMNLWVKLLPSV